MTNWKQIVEAHAARSGTPTLPAATVAELASHLEDVYAAARAEGSSHVDAERRATSVLEASSLADLSRRARQRPDSRPGAIGPEPPASAWTGLAGEVRHAVRQLRRSPSFAAVAILTLGLGAGAATAIFSVVDAVLLKPLPFHAPQELVTLWEANAERGLPHEPISPVNFMDYRGLKSVFADSAAWWRPEVNLAEPGKDPVRIRAVETSANLFSLLGVSPQLGAGFPQEALLYNRTRIAVISDRLWRQQYGADPNIVGKMITANNPYTVAGVMPAGFNFPNDVDLWLRLEWDLTQHSRFAHFMEGVARLAPGASVEQASRELAALSGRLGTQHVASNKNWVARPVALLDDMLGYYRPALIVLMGAVAVLLITACINVASLLLARAGVRGREMAIRAALGASRGRLVRQMLTESLLLAAAGTVAGAAGAIALMKLGMAAMPVNIPRMEQAGLDIRLLGFAAVVTAGTSILFGLVPAMIVSRTRASEALKESGRSSTSARSRKWNRALVVAEIALASMALVASALLVRSVGRMMHVSIGVQADQVLTTSVHLTGEQYRDWGAVEQFYSQLTDAIRRQPGVTGAGVTNALPLDVGWRIPLAIVGRVAPAGEQIETQIISAGDGYFETMGARLVAGRLFDSHDTRTAEAVVVVNETLARREFPNEDPLGKQLTSSNGVGPLGRHLMAPTTPPAPGQPAHPRARHRIIGVIADIQQNPIGRDAEPVVYHTVRQFPFTAMSVAMRGPDTAALTAAARRAVKEINPSLALGDFRTMDERLLRASAEPRVLMFVLTAFAVLTGLLAAIGVYGLLAWVVSERRRELAIRLALGAKPSSLARLVTLQGLVLSAIGIGVGLAGARAVGGILDDVLFETRTSDPIAMAAAGGLLMLAALAACAAPAWRASRVQPNEGLRE
ncbi:MAG: ABC transporter permease [Acidobacteriota bacterium]|nr:ABC transporter permease [Acidobacteriota bacterium]